MEEAPILGILCCGGPAPGLNGVIAAVTLYGERLGWTVQGFHDGYLHLASGDIEEVKQNIMVLTQEIVIQHQREGGSIIRTNHFDPTNSPRKIANCLAMLSECKVKYLLLIGGNNTITCSHFITQGVDPYDMQVIVIPKTIDNDINIPYGQDTFGFHSARVFATELVKNLMMDARSAPRWFVVDTMGKRSGHLALSVAEASGAHVVIIPEDFGDKKVDFSDICDILEGAIIKRLARGKRYGMCIISEGVINQLNSNSIQNLLIEGCLNYGTGGKISFDDSEFSRAVSKEMNKRLKARSLDTRVTSKKIGYELRSQAPNDFDAIYVQQLGYGAVEGFRKGHSNCVVTYEGGEVKYRSFRSMMDPTTGRLLPRRVNIESESYTITRQYLSVLRKEDLKSHSKREKLAKVANMETADFVAKFKKVRRLFVKPN